MRTFPLSLFLIFMTPAMVAHAAKSDRSHPMDIEAASATADISDNGSITLSGNVVITQGSLKVQAPSAVLLRSGGDPHLIVFREGASISQLLDDGTPASGSGDVVEYRLPL
jgi:lipopolysaccharide export system protein LptA